MLEPSLCTAIKLPSTDFVAQVLEAHGAKRNLYAHVAGTRKEKTSGPARGDGNAKCSHDSTQFIHSLADHFLDNGFDNRIGLDIRDGRGQPGIAGIQILHGTYGD